MVKDHATLLRDGRARGAVARSVVLLDVWIDAAGAGATAASIKARFWRSIDDLEIVVRDVAPALARAHGERLFGVMIAIVTYVAKLERGDDSAADDALKLLYPKKLPTRPDPHELLRLAGLKVSGRPPRYEPSDAAELRSRIELAARELAIQRRLITAETIAEAMTVNVKNLGTWTRQLELGSLGEMAEAERKRHGQKLTRRRRS